MRPHTRFCALQYVPLFYRTQRPVLRMGAADRLGIARLRNLLLDFHSACHELKRDQQAAALLQTAMQQQGLQGPLTRVSLLQLEVGPQVAWHCRGSLSMPQASSVIIYHQSHLVIKASHLSSFACP